MNDHGDFRGRKTKMHLDKRFRCAVHGWVKPGRCVANGHAFYCRKCHSKCPNCAAKRFFRFESMW
jgi:predicted Zn-ribbon and HTH transcriptional regulator